MWQCGIGFEVIPRSFHDEKETSRLIAASNINCDLRSGLKALKRKAFPQVMRAANEFS
jgi:hypothetical protein